MSVAQIAAELHPIERRWLIGWDGPAGAAFNCIGESMAERGLTVSHTDWTLSPLGLAVRAALAQETQS
jgi:hypothetical protein